MAGGGKEQEDVRDFLSKVDEIESIMKGLTSVDEEKQQLAMKEADDYLKIHGEESASSVVHDRETGITTKIGFEGTQVNKVVDPPTMTTSGLGDRDGPVSAEDFMKAVNEDVKVRADQLRKHEAKAQELKVKGNAAFKDQNYEEAIRLYSEALEQVKTNTALYTNRAQAFIKVGSYTMAIDDCDAAIKLDEKCVKAYVHKGRALQILTKFDEAIDTFQAALKVVPKQEKVLKDYIADAKSSKIRFAEEKEAVKLMEEQKTEAMVMQTAIDTLMQNGRSTTIYIQAAKAIELLLKKDIHQTLFRTSGGFNITNEENNSPISKFWNCTETPQNKEDMELICAVVKLFQDACAGNDFNAEDFFIKNHSIKLSGLLHSPGSPMVGSAVVSLLYELSQSELGRRGILHLIDFESILRALNELSQQETNTSVVAMSTVNNLALEKEFYEKHSSLIKSEFFRIVSTSMHRLCKVCTKGAPEVTHITWSVVTSGLSALGNMSRESRAREQIGREVDLWDKLVAFMNRYCTKISKDSKQPRDALHALLGLLANLCSQQSGTVQSKSAMLMKHFSSLISSEDEAIIERTLAVLRHLVIPSSEALTSVLTDKLYMNFISLLKSDRECITVRYAIKCLAVCTQDHEEPRQAVLVNHGLDSLVRLLSSGDEVIVGNAALCLSHCALLGEVCQQLVGTEIVLVLLRLATDDKLSVDVRHNTALCLAKLASGDPRHLEKLRELNGLGILHSVFQEKQKS